MFSHFVCPETCPINIIMVNIVPPLMTGELIRKYVKIRIELTTKIQLYITKKSLVQCNLNARAMVRVDVIP